MVSQYIPEWSPSAIAALCRLQLAVHAQHHVRTCDVGVLAIKQDGDFFQGLHQSARVAVSSQEIAHRAPRLDIEEVDRKTLEYEDYDVYNIELPIIRSDTFLVHGHGCLPAKCFNADGIHVLVEDTGQRCEDETERKPFGANVEGQDLDGV